APAGYVPVQLRTASGPANIRMGLERAEAIGGVVRDEQGRPIEGARVFPMAYSFFRPWPEIEASPNSGRAIATTGAQGRWRSDALPAGSRPDAEFRVLVTHPDHVTAAFLTTAREARAFSSVQVMKPGLPISGTVLSPFGRPVRGAT